MTVHDNQSQLYLYEFYVFVKSPNLETIRTVVLPPRGPWQCVDTFLVVTTWGGGVATGNYWVEAGDATQHPQVHRRAPKVNSAEVDKP